MLDFSDNIIKGTQNWEYPYRFIVGRRSRWDNSVEIMGWTADPETAYRAFVDVCEDPTNLGIFWDYFLHDSFHKDAKDFCRLAYEKSSDH